MSRGRDLAGWLGAGAVAAGLFAGAAAAALRLPEVASGAGAVEAVALDLSVGVVSMAAVLPSAPPPVVTAVPEMAEPLPEDVAEPLPQPVAMPRPEAVRPELTLPEAEAPPILPAAPPPPPEPVVKPEPPEPAAAPEPPETETPPLEMAASPRPKARPEVEKPQVAKAEPEPERQPDPAPAEAAPAQAAGAAQAARPAEVKRAAGGSSAARYGDVVMRQIARLRRPKAPDRGVVTVGFEIGAQGELRRVAVVASSGSAALDAVALDHIRRAAPFPPPPEGAATRFAFEFVGK